MVENVIQIKSGIKINVVPKKHHAWKKDYIRNPIVVKMINI